MVRSCCDVVAALFEEEVVVDGLDSGDEVDELLPSGDVAPPPPVVVVLEVEFICPGG